MCALFGFLDYGRKIPIKALQKLLQSLANASEIRGTHATGIAYTKSGAMTIYKRISGIPFLSQLNKSIIDRTVSVWMILTHSITDYTGTFSVGLIRGISQLRHGIKDTPLNRL